MLRILRQDGFTVEPRRLQKIRLEEGVRLLHSTRWMNEADEEAQTVKLQEIVEEELEKGTIKDFGQTHLYCHFRALDHRDVVITQRRLFDAVKRVNPEGVRRRLSQHIRVRKKLRVSATLRNSGWTYRRLARPQTLPYKSRIFLGKDHVSLGLETGELCW